MFRYINQCRCPERPIKLVLSVSFLEITFLFYFFALKNHLLCVCVWTERLQVWFLGYCLARSPIDGLNIISSGGCFNFLIYFDRGILFNLGYSTYFSKFFFAADFVRWFWTQALLTLIFLYEICFTIDFISNPSIL